MDVQFYLGIGVRVECLGFSGGGGALLKVGLVLVHILSRE